MKNTFVKVLSVVMALMMLVGTFSMIPVAAAEAECAHTNSHAVKVVEPTCGVAGFTKYLCDDCGEEFIDDIVKATGEHVMVDVEATEATCTDPAYTAHAKCTQCDYVEGREEIGEALGHVWELQRVEEATCEKDGYIFDVCARCGEEKIADTIEGVHEFVYEVITAPTKCESGLIKATCSVCGFSKEVVKPEDHNWVNIKDVGTCKSEYKSGKTCSDCKIIHPDAEKWGEDGGHNYVNVNFGTVTIDKMNDKIKALGFALNDVTHGTPESCAEPSWSLQHCAVCDTYRVAEGVFELENGTAHVWGEWTTDVTVEDIPENHAFDKVLERECTVDGCDAKDTKLIKAATKHVYESEDAIVVTPPVCAGTNDDAADDYGYTTFTCDLCGESYTDNVTQPLKHSLKVVYKSGVCTDDVVYVKECVREDCDYEEACEVKDYPKNYDKCQPELKWDVPGTCTTVASDYYYECKVCAAVVDFTPEKTPEGTKNPNNHNYTVDEDTGALSDPVGHLTFLDTVSEQSCTEALVEKYLCECGAILNIERLPARGHNEVNDPDNVAYVDVDDDGVYEIDLRPVAPSCQVAVGKTEGQICGECLTTIVKAQEDIVVDLTDFDMHASAGVPVKDVDATCTAKAYTDYYFACCKKTIKVEGGNIDYTAHDLKAVNAKPASCTSDGYEAYSKCSRCNAIFMNDVEVHAIVVIPALNNKNHTWVDVDKVEEECAKDGVKAHQECAVCGVKALDGTILVDNTSTKDKNEITEALKIPAHGLEYMGTFAGVEPTCTEGGYMVKQADASYGYDAAYCCEKCDRVTVDATGHETLLHHYVNMEGGKYIDCTKPMFHSTTCATCGYTEVIEYADKKAADHEYNKDKNGAIAYTEGNPTCTEAATDTSKCKHCQNTLTRTGKPAIGHKIKNANGVEIVVSFACDSDDHIEYEGRKCINGCNKVLGTDKEHTAIITVKAKDATCTDDGYLAFEYCNDCDEPIGEITTIEKLGHNGPMVEENVDGWDIHICSTCKENYKVETAHPATEVFTVSTDTVVAGDVITVTFALTDVVTTFGSKNVTVSYSDAFTFVGVEAAAIDGLYAVPSDNGNEVGVSLFVANDAEGNAQKVTTSAEGTVLFTITFVANKTASGVANIAGHEVTVTGVGNLNGDANVTAEDAQAILGFIGTNDVAADVNLDGVVTLADAIALAKFAASNKTAADYLEMVGELAKLEDEVFAIFDAGRINDLDNNGVANIADAYLLIKNVEAQLAEDYATLGANVTMAAIVAAANRA